MNLWRAWEAAIYCKLFYVLEQTGLCKHCSSSSDCSKWNNLIWVYTVHLSISTFWTTVNRIPSIGIDMADLTAHSLIRQCQGQHCQSIGIFWTHAASLCCIVSWLLGFCKSLILDSMHSSAPCCSLFTLPCLALYPKRLALSGLLGLGALWMAESWRYCQHLTRSRNRRTSLCFFLYISCIYLYAPIVTEIIPKP